MRYYLLAGYLVKATSLGEALTMVNKIVNGEEN